MKYHDHHNQAKEAWDTQNLANVLAGLIDGIYENPNQAGKATRASSATIAHRMRDGKTRREANVKNQALTPTEESVLISFIKCAKYK